MEKALSELKLTIALFAICLGYATMTWLHRLVKHYYHSDVMFFGLGVGMLVMMWACIMRYRNYRKLACELAEGRDANLGLQEPSAGAPAESCAREQGKALQAGIAEGGFASQSAKENNDPNT